MTESTDEKLKMTSQLFTDVTGLEHHAGDTAATLAQMCLSPAMGAALTLKTILQDQYGEQNGSMRLTSLLTELNRQLLDTAADDSMERAQKILAAQATTLDAMFHHFATRALESQTMDRLQTNMTLAFKAQAQSRCTLNTLFDIKNPPSATFVKQANIAAGHQQVNNYGSAPPVQNDPTRAQENPNPQNELLEAPHGEQLDTRTTGAAGANNSPMAAVAEINRTKNRSRKKSGKP